MRTLLLTLAAVLSVVSLWADDAATRQSKAEQRRQRWDVLVLSERTRIEAIREKLKGGGAIAISPEEFEFVYGTKNEILVEEELQASARVTCGPWIDVLGNRLKLSPRDRLELLSRFYAGVPAAIRGQPGRLTTLQRHYATEATKADEIFDPKTDADLLYLRKIGVYTRPFTTGRELSDEAIIFLRDCPFAEAALRAHLKDHPIADK